MTKWSLLTPQWKRNKVIQNWSCIVLLNLGAPKPRADTLECTALSAGSKCVDTRMPEVALINMVQTDYCAAGR